jgi:hypothetical protein
VWRAIMIVVKMSGAFNRGQSYVNVRYELRLQIDLTTSVFAIRLTFGDYLRQSESCLFILLFCKSSFRYDSKFILCY